MNYPQDPKILYITTHVNRCGDVKYEEPGQFRIILLQINKMSTTCINYKNFLQMML